jgi:ketosteroid isomerase-like protein
MVIKKTRRPVASEWVHIFTFRGGRISEFLEFADTATFVAAYRA